jgi:hypothetical protein
MAMNEKIKTFFKRVSFFIVGFFVGVFGTILHHNRKRVTTIREEHARAESTSNTITNTITNIENGTSKLDDVTKSNEDILRAIRERKENN